MHAMLSTPIHDYNFKLYIRVKIMVMANILLGLWVGFRWRLHHIYPVKSPWPDKTYATSYWNDIYERRQKSWGHLRILEKTSVDVKALVILLESIQLREIIHTACVYRVTRCRHAKCVRHKTGRLVCTTKIAVMSSQKRSTHTITLTIIAVTATVKNSDPRY